MTFESTLNYLITNSLEVGRHKAEAMLIFLKEIYHPMFPSTRPLKLRESA
jgi:hypothetical protein